MIVVDANVIVYRHVHGPFTPLAQKLLQVDADWRTAVPWRYEFTSAMLKMIRARLPDDADAVRAIASAAADMMNRDEQPPQQYVLEAALHGRFRV